MYNYYKSIFYKTSAWSINAAIACEFGTRTPSEAIMDAIVMRIT